jgi:hypothetical protein
MLSELPTDDGDDDTMNGEDDDVVVMMVVMAMVAVCVDAVVHEICFFTDPNVRFRSSVARGTRKT